MLRISRSLRIFITSLMAGVILISSPQGVVRTAATDKVSVSLIGKYDSADTAAIRSIDTDAKLIRLRNHETGKTYTLSYDNTSMMYDARGTVLSASLLEVGQIVDVTFLKSQKHVTTLNISNEAWEVENTRDHELVRGDGTAKIQGELYRIDQRSLVMAEGNLSLPEDVLATDTVTVRGIGREIYSVMVTGGHGYVSLSSDTVEDHSLVGAWIELDNEVIHRISPNMLLSAPEGDYNLQILGNGASYTQEVTIDRNQETVVDTSNVKVTKPKEGMVTFQIVPDTAEVFVDGEKVLTETPQSIRYGYHSLKIMADGYITQDKYLKIGTPKSVISITLEKEGGDETSSSSDDASSKDKSSASDASTEKSSRTTNNGEISSNSASSKSTISENSSDDSKKPGNKVIEGYKIYFDKPYGAELYFDGSYIGMVPVSVTKISGSHEVILKKDGYETKSYRISIDKDEVDLNYTFPDLVKIKDDEDKDGSKDKDQGKDKDDKKDKDEGEGESSGDDSSGDDPSEGDSSDEGGSSDSGSSEDSAPGEDTSPSEDSSEPDDPSEESTEDKDEDSDESDTDKSTEEESDEAGASGAATNKKNETG